MAQEGASFELVDTSMKKWGMPMGPFELLDEIGLDIGAHVLKSLGERMDPPLVTPPFIAEVLKRGWLGKKSGRGFYVYAQKKSKNPVVNHELSDLLVGRGSIAQALAHSPENIHWRLVLPMINEAARALDEGVTDSAELVDLATVLGTGFAPFRGGLARFADSIGTEQVVGKLEELAKKHGPRFAPCEPLVRLARAHRPIADSSRPAPAPAAVHDKAQSAVGSTNL
jgi:3-hydroxyacyl-CoA dehydrogenase/enoyl-CoA hydratase/3-hydroxybutyryl-CoA epimerase